MLALLLACADQRSPAPAGPAPYLAPPTTSPPPFDPAAAETALADLVALVPTLDAAPAWEIYADLRAGGDALCPPSFPYSGYEYWYAQCTSASGVTFTGYAYSYDYGYGAGSWYQALYVAGSVVDPDRGTLASTGVFEHSEGPESHDIRLDGVFSWDGALPDEPGAEWIARGLVPTLLTSRGRRGDRRELTIDGGIAGFAGDIDTWDLTDVVYDTDDGCPEPSGALSLRMAGGYWFDSVWGETCDGCADVTWLGVPVGEVCADFSPWATWETP